MNRSAVEVAGCKVSGEERLAAGSGGASALCAAIADARSSGTEPASVEVQILSSSLMVASQQLADGTRLPEVRTARSDRPLGARSFQMLADALAAQLRERRQ